MVSKGLKKMFGMKSKKSSKTEEAAPAPIATPEPVPEVKPTVEEVRDEPIVEETTENPTTEEPTASEEVDEEAEEENEEEDAKEVKVERVDSMHANIYIPLGAKSGDVLDIEHDGGKKIVIPTGQAGETIQVKMVTPSVEEEQETGMLCGCY